MAHKPLGIFACVILAGITVGCLHAASPNAPQVRRFVITDYGAVGDGKTLNTPSLQSLIDNIAARGGGILVVPRGSFLTGPLFFKQGVDLLVEKDATLLASTTVADYPQIPTRWEGVERVWTSAFLNFDHMTHVTVTGDGSIDGQGDIWMQRSPRQRGPRTASTLPGATTAASQPSSRPAQRGRPRLICFSNCEHVRMSNLHLLKQPVWCLHILYSHDVVVDNINIRAVARIPSSDGIDVDSSRDVTLSHCDIACNDDNISIKSGKDDDGRRVNRPSENITISDCALGVGAGIAMGSEITGSIRHVLVERCTFTGTDAAARFKSQPSRGGTVEDITFRDITLNNVRFPFEFNLQWRMVPPVLPPAKVLSVVRDIHFLRFNGTARTGGTIAGMPESPVGDVTFEECTIAAQTGLRLTNTADIDTRGLHLTVQDGPPIILNARPTPSTQPRTPTP